MTKDMLSRDIILHSLRNGTKLQEQTMPSGFVALKPALQET